MTTQIIEARMVFLIINSIDILEEHQNVDGDHDSFVERFHEDVIDPRSQQVKRMMKQEVIGTIGTTQTRNQACCSRRNGMTMRIDVRLVHRRKLVLRE